LSFANIAALRPFIERIRRVHRCLQNGIASTSVVVTPCRRAVRYSLYHGLEYGFVLRHCPCGCILVGASCARFDKQHRRLQGTVSARFGCVEVLGIVVPFSANCAHGYCREWLLGPISNLQLACHKLCTGKPSSHQNNHRAQFSFLRDCLCTKGASCLALEAAWL
jgi:hypothetical protein